jgi:hypothetical protein
MEWIARVVATSLVMSLVPAALGQTSGVAVTMPFGASLTGASLPDASLPDAPEAVAADLSPTLPHGNSSDNGDADSQTATQQSTPAGVAPATEQTADQKKASEEQLKKQEQQRVLGIIPAFNSVYAGNVPPLTPGQKFRLMFKSTTDIYVFGFAAFTAGISQAQDSHAAYGQGAEGYAKRFGANYADTADGNFWGNAVLPVVLHEDPRYFRLGQGSYTRRALYSMSTAVWCRRDNGTRGPNYANVLGNLIAGGISNIYYPSEDRGAAQTFQNAFTVTAEGMIGAALIEFWPDVTQHYHLKRQAKRDAAAKAAQQTDTTAKPPQ